MITTTTYDVRIAPNPRYKAIYIYNQWPVIKVRFHLVHEFVLYDDINPRYFRWNMPKGLKDMLRQESGPDFELAIEMALEHYQAPDWQVKISEYVYILKSLKFKIHGWGTLIITGEKPQS